MHSNHGIIFLPEATVAATSLERSISWKSLKFSKGMPGLPLLAKIERFSERTVTVTACCSQSEETLQAISNAMVSMVSELPAKTSRTLDKQWGKLRNGR